MKIIRATSPFAITYLRPFLKTPVGVTEGQFETVLRGVMKNQPDALCIMICFHSGATDEPEVQSFIIAYASEDEEMISILQEFSVNQMNPAVWDGVVNWAQNIGKLGIVQAFPAGVEPVSKIPVDFTLRSLVVEHRFDGKD